MNVAFLIQSFGGFGGTEGYSAQLARHLARCGDSVHVYCLDADPAAVSDASVRVTRLQGGGRGWARIAAFHRACRQLDLDGYGVVQGFGRCAGHTVYRAGGGVHAAYLSAMAKGSLQDRMRRWDPREMWAVRVDDQCFRRARIVFCNSEMASGEAMARHPNLEVRMIRNGVDGERFRPSKKTRQQVRSELGVPSGGRVVLFPGSGFRRKGLRVASHAFNQVTGPFDRLVVLGRDGRLSRYRAQMEVMLAGRAIFLGPRTDPERWMAAADASLLSTRYDSGANTTLECMASGVPTVSTSRDGSSEVLPDRRWCVTDPLDVEATACALQVALESGEAGGQAARAAVLPWTRARNGDAVRALYSEVTGD